MNYVPTFRKAFKIDQKADLANVAIAVNSIYTAEQIASSYLGNIDPSDNGTGFRIHVLINLIGRVCEHAKAMLVALSTGSPASAEALARIVVEGSVNVMYLATLGDSGTLNYFFRSWLDEHDRKLMEWNQMAQDDGAVEVLTMIKERRQLVQQLQNFVSQNEIHCEIDKSKSAEWPKSLFKRFEALNRKTDYYTSYHRLSGASHLTGEDTLTWLMSTGMPDGMRHKLGKEAWSYSIMMTRISSTFFVDAVAACVISHGRAKNDDLRDCKAALAKAAHEIAGEAGVPGK
ncbi:DUF5677 domain-containing protein [Rhodoferax sp.]|uniref:DUF5677 domain-containing protein n=1 Tax=Rhodoferax sp. TaxID=50421 RepID=UPI00273185A6|nr:DUF5677 domain-containing protein [Rhodoferax sp.]MDP2442490.1 DUF5677 domain-containing protein [Rhodoferax sp.]MDZ4209156.1 DUF5677 domain-containing protein [Rhodoferax sp.]